MGRFSERPYPQNKMESDWGRYRTSTSGLHTHTHVHAQTHTCARTHTHPGEPMLTLPREMFSYFAILALQDRDCHGTSPSPRNWQQKLAATLMMLINLCLVRLGLSETGSEVYLKLARQIRLPLNS